MPTILLIEDNEIITKGLDYLFTQENYLLLSAKTLEKAKEYIETKNYDLILLDVTLPDGDGFEFFSSMKNEISVPLIFLTAKDLSDDIINGLELGACDYITKPFHNRELLLRINNALKYKKENKELKIEDITIDPLKMEVKKQEQIINLTTLEYQLFLYLVENKNRIVTREMLYEKIYELSGNDVSDNTLTVYIKRIREKLGSENIIKTIKGIGYRVSSWKRDFYLK